MKSFIKKALRNLIDMEEIKRDMNVPRYDVDSVKADVNTLRSKYDKFDAFVKYYFPYMQEFIDDPDKYKDIKWDYVWDGEKYNWIKI